MQSLVAFPRVQQDTLEVEFRFEDPKAFTKPWEGKKAYRLEPPGFEILEHFVCDHRMVLEKKPGVRPRLLTE